MNSYTSYLIIQARILNFESNRFNRIYKAFEKTMYKKENKLNCFWITKQTNTGVKIKFYFDEISKSKRLLNDEAFSRFVNLINNNFSFKLQITYPSSHNLGTNVI